MEASAITTKYTVGLNPKGESENFPQIWCSKINGQLLVVIPWFDMLQDETLIEGQLSVLDTRITDSRKFKIGALAQVGWLVQNEHGIYFGVNMAAMKCMEKVGEL